MNWLPTPIVRRAVPIRTVGQYVEDENGSRWGSLTVYGKPVRCQWCHEPFSVGWVAGRIQSWIEVCAKHIAVDWSAPWVELGLPTYIGPGDPVHKRPARRRKAS